MNQYSFFVVLAPAGVAVGIALALFLWRHRATRGTLALFWYVVAVTGFLFLNLLELVARQPLWTHRWAILAYPFIAFFPVGWFSFAMQHAQRDRWLKAGRLVLLCLVPSVTVVVALTNRFHRLLWQSWAVRWIGGFSALSVQYGRWFWVHAVYSFSLLIVGSAIITGEYVRSHRLFQRQSRLLVVGVVVPILFNVVYVFRLVPGFSKDYSPLVYALSGVLFTVSIFRYGLLDVVPVARQTLFETMNDGILVLDRLERVVDVNAAAAAILGVDQDELIGRPLVPRAGAAGRAREAAGLESEAPGAARALGALGATGATGSSTVGAAGLESGSTGRVPAKLEGRVPSVPAELATGATRFDHCQAGSDGPRTWDVQVTPLRDDRGQSVGRLVMFHEVTELRRLVDQVDELTRVDSLTGLYTRNYVVERLAVERERSQQLGRPLALLLIDVDRFRQVSADHGLVTAERVVSRVAEVVRRESGDRAVIGRFGVAAFLVLLPEADAEGAMAAAERVRQTVAGGVGSGGVGSGGPAVTVSVGVLAADAQTTLGDEELLKRADMALYTAKGAGRNALYLWREEEYPAVRESGRSDSEA